VKRFFLIPALACVLTLSVCAQGSRNAGQTALTGGSALIVYYTWSGNSAQIARELQSLTGCDALEITLVTPYTSNYNEMLEAAKSEFQKIDSSGVYPAIKTSVSLKDYDTVFIVYPLWWSRMAVPMQTFLHNNRQDLAGKTIALICDMYKRKQRNIGHYRGCETALSRQRFYRSLAHTSSECRQREKQSQ